MTGHLGMAQGFPKVGYPLPSRGHKMWYRWCLGTHQGAISPEHLDYYLDEYTFRFNRRRFHAPGMLFYRLLEQSVTVDPVAYRRLVGGKSRQESKTPGDHKI